MQIHLNNALFLVSEPYNEGQTIGQAEARVLNTERAERMQKALARRSRREGDYASLAKWLAELDSTYSLATAKTFPPAVPASVEEELVLLRAEKGLAPEHEDEGLFAEAKRRVEARRVEASKLLEELFL